MWCTLVMWCMPLTEVLKFLPDECSGAVTSYGVWNVMYSEHHPQFDGYCGCGSGRSVCLNPFLNAPLYSLCHTTIPDSVRGDGEDEGSIKGLLYSSASIATSITLPYMILLSRYGDVIRVDPGTRPSLQWSCGRLHLQ